jgi:hypothetical protein
MIKSKYKKLVSVSFGIIVLSLILGILAIKYLEKKATEVFKKQYTNINFHKPLSNFKYNHQIENGKLVIYITHENFEKGKTIEYFALSDMTTKPPTPVWEVHLFGKQNVTKIIYGEISEKETQEHKVVIPPKVLISGHKYSLLVIDSYRLRVSPEYYDFVYEP